MYGVDFILEDETMDLYLLEVNGVPALEGTTP